jgi:hypothetical protein
LATGDEARAVAGADLPARQCREAFRNAEREAEHRIGRSGRRGREIALLVGIASVHAGIETRPQIRSRRRWRLDVKIGRHCGCSKRAERDAGKKHSFQNEPPTNRESFD